MSASRGWKLATVAGIGLALGLAGPKGAVPLEGRGSPAGQDLPGGQPPPARQELPGADGLGPVVSGLMDEFGVPGLALVIVRGDSVVAELGLGVARVGEDLPVDPSATVFRVASVAKLFVSTVVSRLAVEGTLDLDRDIAEYLPDLRMAGPFDEPITLRHLLTHTAGFDERLLGYAAERRAEIRPLGEYLEGNLPDRGWPPGDVVGYSNHGVALAAYVGERVTGIPFDELAASSLFEPLGMTRTQYLDPPSGSAQTRAAGHRCRPGQGALEQRCDTAPEVFSHPYPVGLAYATAADMGRFLRAHLNGGAVDGNDGVPAAAIELSQTEQFSHSPGLPGMSLGFMGQRLLGRRALAHAGSVPGMRTLLLLVPGEDLGFFFAVNGGDSGFGEVLRDSLAVRFMGPAGILESSDDSDGSGEVALGALAGTYQMTRYPHRTVEAFSMRFGTTARVFVDEDSGPGLFFDGRSYTPVGSLRFRESGGDRFLQFERDGRTGRLRMYAPAAVFGAELPAAYERLPWYGEPGFLNEYLSYLVALPILLLLFGWPMMAGGAWWLRRKRGGNSAGSPAGAMVPTGAAGALIVAVLFHVGFTAFGFGFVARATRMFESSTGIVHGMTPGMRGLLALPWGLAVLAAAMCYLCVSAWRRGYWGPARRSLYAVLTASALLAVHFLIVWSYLPARW